MLLSTEKPRCRLVDMSGGEGNLLDYQARSQYYPVPFECQRTATARTQAGEKRVVLLKF